MALSINVLPATQRPSTQETLYDLYQSISSTVSAPSGIRSHLINRPGDRMAWGLSSQAGSPTFATTNYTVGNRTPRTYQPSQFAVGMTPRVTSFTDNAQKFAFNDLKVPTSRYTDFTGVSAGLSTTFSQSRQRIRSNGGVRNTSI